MVRGVKVWVANGAQSVPHHVSCGHLDRGASLSWLLCVDVAFGDSSASRGTRRGFAGSVLDLLGASD